MSSPVLSSIAFEEILAARERIADSAIRTPLVRLNTEQSAFEVWLKLENLQPIGSFKLRGAGNAIGAADPELLREGVFTASAGNMAQGVAWEANRLGIDCAVIVPDRAADAKKNAVAAMGARVIEVSFDAWWEVMTTHRFDGLDGVFIHPVANPHVIAGNGTIGLEILEDLPDADQVLIPFGGGGLSCGIAAALRGAGSGAKALACEIDTAAPLTASMSAGEPVDVEVNTGFIDGIGGPTVLREMWPLVRDSLDGVLTVSIDEAAAAVRLLAERNHVIAEGAGAVPVAAAMRGDLGAKKIVCVVSGGNIDASKLLKILAGDTP